MGTASELIAELRQLVEEGATAAEIVEAVTPVLEVIEQTVQTADRALRSVTEPLLFRSRVTFKVTLTPAEKQRRYREKLKQKQGLGKANDVPDLFNGVTSPVTDSVTISSSCVPPDPLHTKTVSLEKERFLSKKERKEESIRAGAGARARGGVARGARLQVGSKIPPDCYEAGLLAGLSGERVLLLWAEFVDYWCAVPGQRGLKLNWLATWRNRLRHLNDEGKLNGRRKSVHEATDDLIARIRQIEEPVRGAAGETAVRMLPPR